jgi:hypothetical protein
MLELVARATGDASLSRRAATIVSAYRLADGLFTEDRCAGDSACHGRPSTIASAVGSWVTGTRAGPHGRWIERGLCRAYACPDGAGGADLSLRAVAVAVACDSAGCGRRFPVPV